MKSLLEKKKISEEELKLYQNLKIIGLIGSIDNDFIGSSNTKINNI
jgi:hypothetical protein